MRAAVRNHGPIIRRREQLAGVLIGILMPAAFVSWSLGQSPIAQGTLLVRNVRIPDERNIPVVCTVLIRAGKIVKVDPALPVPAGITVIDGGGNFLTIADDGTIKFSAPSAAGISSDRHSAGPSITEVQKKGTPSYLPADRQAASFSRSNFPVSNKRQQNLNSPEEQQTQKTPNDNLAAKVVDPSAPLSTILFQEKYVPSLWGIDDDENEVMMQVAIPWKLAKKANIFRVTLPFLTNTPAPGNNGVGDVGVLNVTVLPQKWGNLLVGPVASFATNKGPGVDTFAIGPAVGAILKNGKWLYGIFNQNLFSFGGDIATSQFQPILAYTVNPKVSFAIGDAQYVFNWKRGGRLTAAPLSGQVNYIHMFGEQPVRLFFNAQYSLANDFGARKWTLSPGFALILK